MFFAGALRPWPGVLNFLREKIDYEQNDKEYESEALDTTAIASITGRIIWLHLQKRI